MKTKKRVSCHYTFFTWFYLGSGVEALGGVDGGSVVAVDGLRQVLLPQLEAASGQRGQVVEDQVLLLQHHQRIPVESTLYSVHECRPFPNMQI